MIRGKHLLCFLLGFLALSIACAPVSRKTLRPGSPEDVQGCYTIFPSAPWESVHRIEATIGGGSSSLLGVTRGEPSERILESILLTPEGFILFDAELREGKVVVRKAVPPFDSPAFARGLMEDVSLLFLPPQAKPTGWEKEMDGTTTCSWENPDQSLTKITGSMENGWKILRQNKRGKVTREVVLYGPLINGLASHVELRAFKPASYRLMMTLIELSP